MNWYNQFMFMVCLYVYQVCSPDQNQILAHEINLLYCQGHVMAWNP